MFGGDNDFLMLVAAGALLDLNSQVRAQRMADGTYFWHQHVGSAHGHAHAHAGGHFHPDPASHDHVRVSDRAGWERGDRFTRWGRDRHVALDGTSTHPLAVAEPAAAADEEPDDPLSRGIHRQVGDVAAIAEAASRAYESAVRAGVARDRLDAVLAPAAALLAEVGEFCAYLGRVAAEGTEHLNAHHDVITPDVVRRALARSPARPVPGPGDRWGFGRERLSGIVGSVHANAAELSTGDAAVAAVALGRFDQLVDEFDRLVDAAATWQPLVDALCDEIRRAAESGERRRARPRWWRR